MASGSSFGLTRSRQRPPNCAEVCHIVQHVVVLHRMLADGTEFVAEKAATVAAR